MKGKEPLNQETGSRSSQLNTQVTLIAMGMNLYTLLVCV